MSDTTAKLRTDQYVLTYENGFIRYLKLSSFKS